MSCAIYWGNVGGGSRDPSPDPIGPFGFNEISFSFSAKRWNYGADVFIRLGKGSKTRSRDSFLLFLFLILFFWLFVFFLWGATFRFRFTATWLLQRPDGRAGAYCHLLTVFRCSHVYLTSVIFFLKKKIKKFNCFIVYGTWWRAGRVVIFADFSLQLLGRPIISVIARCQMRADDEMDKRGKWRSKLTDWSDYCARSR